MSCVLILFRSGGRCVLSVTRKECKRCLVLIMPDHIVLP